MPERCTDNPTLKTYCISHVCCCCSYLSCFFYAEKSLLMIAELPLPDTMFGQIFQMANYLFGAFSMSIILGQVVLFVISSFLYIYIFFLSFLHYHFAYFVHLFFFLIFVFLLFVFLTTVADLFFSSFFFNIFSKTPMETSNLKNEIIIIQIHTRIHAFICLKRMNRSQ